MIDAERTTRVGNMGDMPLVETDRQSAQSIRAQRSAVISASIDERECDMGTKQVRIEEVERGFLYLQGCLDIARSRSTDLSRDFDYVERKLTAARPSLVDRGLFGAVTEALKTCRKLADQGRYEQADDTLSAIAGRLKSVSPHSPSAGRAYPRH